MYKDQVGSMLYQHVFPVFQNPHGHLRARVSIFNFPNLFQLLLIFIFFSLTQACWFIQHVCDVKINDDAIWKNLTALCVNALLTDKELPVKVQAGLAIQALLIAEDKVEPLLEPQVCNIFFTSC